MMYLAPFVHLSYYLICDLTFDLLYVNDLMCMWQITSLCSFFGINTIWHQLAFGHFSWIMFRKHSVKHTYKHVYLVAYKLHKQVHIMILKEQFYQFAVNFSSSSITAWQSLCQMFMWLIILVFVNTWPVKYHNNHLSYCLFNILFLTCLCDSSAAKYILILHTS